MKRHHRGAAVGVIAALLSACTTVGPNYDGPPETAGHATRERDFARASVAPVVPVPPPARWWNGVTDPLLARLVDDAFAASPTLQAAVARVRSALAQQSLNRANLGPSGSVGGRYMRGRIPTGSLGQGGGSGAASIPDPIDIDSISVSVTASWELDLFGGTRRSIEGATAAAQAQQAALEDAQVTLASDMAQAYTRLREAQSRQALAQETISLRRRSLDLTRQRLSLGTAATGDVERAEAELAQARAEVPALDTQVEQQLDQIALLAGREPGAYDSLLAVPQGSLVAMPAPPDIVAVGEPADWLRRRPDIRQAERTLASRNAAIGQNVAAMFPSVSLLGFLGTAGRPPDDLFRGSPIRLLTPSLTWNFLDLDRNGARVRGAEADRDESIAQYRGTVLAALQDANVSLSRFGRARETLALLDVARDAARRAAETTRRRHERGTVSLLELLDAERQRTQAEDRSAQARANLMVAYASLQKSLGLGWDAPPPADPVAATHPAPRPNQGR